MITGSSDCTNAASNATMPLVNWKIGSLEAYLAHSESARSDRKHNKVVWPAQSYRERMLSANQMLQSWLLSLPYQTIVSPAYLAPRYPVYDYIWTHYGFQNQGCPTEIILQIFGGYHDPVCTVPTVPPSPLGGLNLHGSRNFASLYVQWWRGFLKRCQTALASYSSTAPLGIALVGRLARIL